MKLHRAERDNYVLTITVTPPVVGTWQASFDDGTTYADGVLDSGAWSWLVAGPDFDAVAVGLDPLDTVATIETDTVPLLRVKDDPVLDIEQGPPIRLWS